MTRLGPVLGLLLLAACEQRMRDQPRAKPYGESAFFADRLSSRPLVEGTVAQGDARLDVLLHEGVEDGKPAERFPFPVTRETLARGRQRYDIFCAPCHGRTGTGDGMIVRRGFRRPPSFHDDRLRQAPAGHFYDVLRRGFGAMPDYADQIEPADRWAVVAWLRVLQRARDGRLEDVPPDARQALEGAGP
jgi:hypothetical protein